VHKPLITLALYLFSSPCFAQSPFMSDVEQFQKCYAQLTGRPLPINHPTRLLIENKSKTGDQACTELIDQGELNSGDYRVSGGRDDGILVLRHLYEFHRTWFTRQVFEQMASYSGGTGTNDVYDSTEPALSISYAMFAPLVLNAKYADTLTGMHGFYALRQLDLAKSATYFPGASNGLPSRRIQPGADYGDSFVTMACPQSAPCPIPGNQMLNFIPVQIGELVGIQPDTRITPLADYDPFLKHFYHHAGTTPDDIKFEAASTTPTVQPTFNLFQTQGGGVFGMSSFMLLNWGHEPGRLADGSTKLPRRWAKEILGSLLCKDLPALRDSDAPPVSPPNSSIGNFRKGKSCLGCHATMDQLAAVGRNQWVAQSALQELNPPDQTFIPGHSAKVTYLMGRSKVTSSEPEFNWLEIGVDGYEQQTPFGRLYFRTFDGALVDKPINGIAEAGNAMANTGDFYECAVKRYFEYFTHIKVLLFDRGDPRNQSQLASLPPSSIYQRMYVEQLARELKSHQSLRQTAKDIMTSKYYKDASCRTPMGCL
jgi:hypothetical protein